MANLIDGIMELSKKSYKFGLALSSENRLKILDWLNKHPEPITMRKLYEKIGGNDFMSYKSFYKNMIALKEADIVGLNKDKRATGQAVTVILKLKK